jgi:hypothetical protein
VNILSPKDIGKPQRATDNEARDDGIIVRKRGKEIVSLTILDAPTR